MDTHGFQCPYYIRECALLPDQIKNVQGNSKVQREHAAAIPRRATARVPTPLHTAPALTMKTKGASPATSHCKGGGGVERGGDPCGRPAGNRRCMLPLDF